jgi:hypothetical protein
VKCGKKKMAMGGMAGRPAMTGRPAAAPMPAPNARAMASANPNARFMKKGGTVRGAGAATRGKKFSGC